MIVSIHQPEHLPWPGLINKASKSEIFVILDNVSFRKNYFQNRNLIYSQRGKEWLTIPVRKANGKLIRDVRVLEKSDVWKKKYLKKLYYSYNKTPFFNQYFKYIEEIINKNYEKLIDYNMDLIKLFFTLFDINSKIVFSSNLETTSFKGDMII